MNSLVLDPEGPYAEDMVVEAELAAPMLLIAVPQLGDPNFNRGVVLVLEHNDEGSMGLVINRPTNLNIKTFCDSQSLEYKSDGTDAVYQGGPVQTDRAFILHDASHRGPETEDVDDQLRLSYSLESLQMLCGQPPDDIRFYLGYSGWGPGQLADELTAGAWLHTELDPSLVFAKDPDAVWSAALDLMGIAPVQLMHSGSVH